MKKQGTTDFLLVCLSVDGMVYLRSSKSVVADKACMMENFEMSDLGLLHYFLGVEVNQSSDGIFISQRKYATVML